MKKHRLFVGLFLVHVSFSALAGWQVVKPNACPPREPFFEGSRSPVIPRKWTAPPRQVEYRRVQPLMKPAPPPRTFFPVAAKRVVQHKPPVANCAVKAKAPSKVYREPFFQAPIKVYPARKMLSASKPAVFHDEKLALPERMPAPALLPAQYANFGRPVAIYAISVSGSLKENIERIMGRYHWKVVWKAPYDFNFDGRVTGTSLTNVVDKLFRPFPLQAVMYMSNRTLAIVPRHKI